MERIHKKSALPEASSLLLAARELGAELSWDRYERQLPLCGFTSNGLSCRKCFRGPCRINPFGDEPSRGVCGADRDQIVMENLFQATLEGVLESARTLRLLGGDGAGLDLPDIGSDLPAGTRERLSQAGLLPVRTGDLFGLQNAFFSHKGYLSHTLKELSRLGLIHYGLLKEGASEIGRAQLQGTPFHPEGINLLIVGQGPAGLLQALEQAAGRRTGGRGINLLVQGSHEFAALKAAADQGSPELALGMNLDALILSPNADWPGLETLAGTYGIPVILVDGGRSPAQTAALAIEQATRHAEQASGGAAGRLLPAPESGRAVLERVPELKQAVASGEVKGVAVVFGEANVQQTYFERTLALLEAALAGRVVVLLGGDLGSQIESLSAELARRRAAQLSAFASDLARRGLAPLASFGSAFGIPRVVSLLSALAGEKGTGSPPAVIAFPEFYRASTWATAVSLLSLGFAVQIGVRLPFWGSPALGEVLTGAWQEITGGRLLAAPALLDPSAQAEELVSFFAA